LVLGLEVGLLIMAKRMMWGQERGKLGMLFPSRRIERRPLQV
jgi:hypothetical protein